MTQRQVEERSAARIETLALCELRARLGVVASLEQRATVIEERLRDLLVGLGAIGVRRPAPRGHADEADGADGNSHHEQGAPHAPSISGDGEVELNAPVLEVVSVL